jgi:hypothetical protein
MFYAYIGKNLHATFMQVQSHGKHILGRSSSSRFIHMAHKAVAVPLVVVIPLTAFATDDAVWVI